MGAVMGHRHSAPRGTIGGQFGEFSGAAAHSSADQGLKWQKWEICVVPPFGPESPVKSCSISRHDPLSGKPTFATCIEKVELL